MLLSSLPVLAPPPQHILATSHTSHHLNPGASSGSSSQDNPNAPPHRSRRDHKQPLSNKPPALSLISLAQSEELIEHRKNSIATFGYSWIKPAGCAKTMLGRREEEIEREDMERQIREAEEAEMRGDGAAFDDGGLAEGEGELEDDGMEQRDLDDDVPDADQTNLDDDDDELGNETGFTAEGVDEGEDTGFITGDGVGGTDLGMDDDELMMGGDLDGDVPSAEQSRLDFDDDEEDEAEGGEWQHTDSEEELDDDSDANEVPPRTQPRPNRQSMAGTVAGEDSEMMDMDITRASIETGDSPAFSAAPASFTQRVMSGNIFNSPSYQPSATSTPPQNNVPLFPPNSNIPGTTSTTSAGPTGRRSWFSSSHRATPPNLNPTPSAPNPDSSGAPQPPVRPRRNIFSRAASATFFSSTTPTNTTSPAGALDTPPTFNANPQQQQQPPPFPATEQTPSLIQQLHQTRQAYRSFSQGQTPAQGGGSGPITPEGMGRGLAMTPGMISPAPVAAPRRGLRRTREREGGV